MTATRQEPNYRPRDCGGWHEKPRELCPVLVTQQLTTVLCKVYRGENTKWELNED